MLETTSQIIDIILGALGVLLLLVLIAISFGIKAAIKKINKITERVENVTTLKGIWGLIKDVSKKKSSRD